MNFNKEIAEEFDKIGVKYELRKIPNEKQGTSNDYRELENKIACHAKENDIMLIKSYLFTANKIII